MLPRGSISDYINGLFEESYARFPSVGEDKEFIRFIIGDPKRFLREELSERVHYWGTVEHTSRSVTIWIDPQDTLRNFDVKYCLYNRAVEIMVIDDKQSFRGKNLFEIIKETVQKNFLEPTYIETLMPEGAKLYDKNFKLIGESK